MYGKPRIVIQKDLQICLAGGGTYGPIGIVVIDVPGCVTARIFKDQWDRRKGFEDVRAKSKKELREIVNRKYNWIEGTKR